MSGEAGGFVTGRDLPATLRGPGGAGHVLYPGFAEPPVGEALGQLISGTEDFLATMRDYGVGVHSGGGETADVGDLTGTVTVDSCAVVVMDRKDVVDNANVKPGLAIVGLMYLGMLTRLGDIIRSNAANIRPTLSSINSIMA